jgi:MSHA biogenesis protein MshL
MTPSKRWWTTCSCLLLMACTAHPVKPVTPPTSARTPQSRDILPIIKRSIPLPAPTAAAKSETYSVVVSQVPVQEILFALARDAKLNLDILEGIQGTVTLNAINQTLPRILNRIAKQVDMRHELEGQNLTVMPDNPYLKHYKIDYVNMARESEGTISNATQVGSASFNSPTGQSSGNNSALTIKNTSKNNFWDTLTQNIKDILRETDKILPAGASEMLVQQNTAASTNGTLSSAKKSPAKTPGMENFPGPGTIQEGATTITRTSTFREAAAVISNPESGIVTVRATGKQHEKILEFVDQIMASVRRQVLIEATVVEVVLNDQYQQGINWSRMRQGSTGLQLSQAATPGLPTTNTGSLFVLDYVNSTSWLGNLSAQVSLLESFGKVKVLSSPKISVMNNQTAMLRVVDNLVYFIISTTTTAPTSTSAAFSTFSTTPNTVPIGFTMSVTPQISDKDTVLLNLRPSISRLIGYVNDPNPDLAHARVVSRIPQTQTREMESVLKIESNQIAVLGGLMQDEIHKLSDGIPGLSGIPLAGNLFMHRNDMTQKSELVIFLHPVVLKDASLAGDFSNFSGALPAAEFFRPTSQNNPNISGP